MRSKILSYLNNKIFFIVLNIILICGLAFNMFTFYDSNHTNPQIVLQPDAFMENVTTIIMDKQGNPTMKIVTANMTHYAKDDITEFTAPYITLYRKSPEPWYISAKYGKATHGVDLVYFWQDVNIQHAADKNNPATLIKTPTLTVDTKKQIAETKDLIIFTQPGTMVQATGMYADMNTGDIKLLSQARGEYVSNF